MHQLQICLFTFCVFADASLIPRFKIKTYFYSWHADSPTHPFPSSQAIFNRRVVIVDPNTGDEIGVQEAIKQDLIDSDTARKLLAQEGKWEEEQ